MKLITNETELRRYIPNAFTTVKGEARSNTASSHRLYFPISPSLLFVATIKRGGSTILG